MSNSFSYQNQTLCNGQLSGNSAERRFRYRCQIQRAPSARFCSMDGIAVHSCSCTHPLQPHTSTHFVSRDKSRSQHLHTSSSPSVRLGAGLEGPPHGSRDIRLAFRNRGPPGAAAAQRGESLSPMTSGAEECSGREGRTGDAGRARGGPHPATDAPILVVPDTPVCCGAGRCWLVRRCWQGVAGLGGVTVTDKQQQQSSEGAQGTGLVRCAGCVCGFSGADRCMGV